MIFFIIFIFRRIQTETPLWWQQYSTIEQSKMIQLFVYPTTADTHISCLQIEEIKFISDLINEIKKRYKLSNKISIRLFKQANYPLDPEKTIGDYNFEKDSKIIMRIIPEPMIGGPMIFTFKNSPKSYELYWSQENSYAILKGYDNAYKALEIFNKDMYPNDSWEMVIDYLGKNGWEIIQ